MDEMMHVLSGTDCLFGWGSMPQEVRLRSLSLFHIHELTAQPLQQPALPKFLCLCLGFMFACLAFFGTIFTDCI